MVQRACRCRFDVAGVSLSPLPPGADFSPPMREVDGWILLIPEPSFQFPISSRFFSGVKMCQRRPADFNQLVNFNQLTLSYSVACKHLAHSLDHLTD
jgi:hypothetical protein